MVFGQWTVKQIPKLHVNNIKATIPWIRNQDMEFMSGKMVGHTKGIFRMIIEMGMDNCSI